MGQQQGGVMGLVLPIALFIGIFYFMIIRPQKKKQQQHDKMLSSISRGDTVITAGGFFGKVTDTLDDSYIIELADGVKARILKSSISIRRDEQDGGARPPRPKKKDRPRKDAPADEKQDELSSETQGEGVTPEETTALIEETADVAVSGEEAVAASDTGTAEKTEKTD